MTDQLRQKAQKLLYEAAGLTQQANRKQIEAADIIGGLKVKGSAVESKPIDATVIDPSAQTVRTQREFYEALEASGPRKIVVDPAMPDLMIDRTVKVKHSGLELINEVPLFSDKFTGTLVEVKAPHCDITGLYGKHNYGKSKENRNGDILTLLTGAHDINLRNCSFTFGTDENMDGWGNGINDVLIDECIFAFCLDPHSMGMIVGGGSNKNWTIKRSLFAYNNNRNPYAAVDGLECVNNFIYKTGARGIQAFGRYEAQTQTYRNNFVFHKKNSVGSWGSANAGNSDGGKLNLLASGNLNNVSRRSLADDENVFWQSPEMPNNYPVGYAEPNADDLPAESVWESIRSSVGSAYRPKDITDLISEIDRAWNK